MKIDDDAQEVFKAGGEIVKSLGLALQEDDESATYPLFRFNGELHIQRDTDSGHFDAVTTEGVKVRVRACNQWEKDFIAEQYPKEFAS